ncbi:MAG: chemotaxis protein CheV [Marinospirillum sp.]|uniref:chemotaxis protein n=1 Tax=Marinospirillum sp. TaxID=2183934 RepID=UPI001A00473D|nr:chemotaxis protein [Marinospirillum sp.]MBE0506054.1 chemotaxis protein CheV [Marinospirillum sp.]
MAGVLDSVDSRTRLVGQNRLELLMFKLHSNQLFAINVFKVQEVLRLPKLTSLPGHHPHVVGIAYLRGQAVPVINLAQAIGMPALEAKPESSLIVTEYNSTIQAFLVGGVDRIVNLNWEDIIPPPRTSGRQHYLTAITRMDDKIIEIIDVEKVLAEINPYTIVLDPSQLEDDIVNAARDMEVLMVDDSPTAISQVQQTLAPLGIIVHTATNGKKGLDLMKQWADAGENVPEKLLMLITDAEMPEMDGYSLTSAVREDPRLRDTFVVLHTSMSGNFNKAMVEKVGCDDFLSKFQPKLLAQLVENRVRIKAGLAEIS